MIMHNVILLTPLPLLPKTIYYTTIKQMHQLWKIYCACLASNFYPKCSNQ